MNASSKCVHAAAALLLLGIVLMTPPSFAQPFCRSEAHEWVEAHRDGLPRTYEDLAVLPVAYRRAVYSTLPAATRAELWRTQLERVLEVEKELTPAQRAVVLEAIQLATPDTFAATKDRSSLKHRQMRRRIESLEARAREAFGADRAAGIFARIGPADRDTLFFLDREKAIAKVSSLERVGVVDVSTPACSCSDASDYCSSGFNCTPGGCIRINDECGTFWVYDCDGLCKVNNVTSVNN